MSFSASTRETGNTNSVWETRIPAEGKDRWQNRWILVVVDEYLNTAGPSGHYWALGNIFDWLCCSMWFVMTCSFTSCFLIDLIISLHSPYRYLHFICSLSIFFYSLHSSSLPLALSLSLSLSQPPSIFTLILSLIVSQLFYRSVSSFWHLTSIHPFILEYTPSYYPAPFQNFLPLHICALPWPLSLPYSLPSSFLSLLTMRHSSPSCLCQSQLPGIHLDEVLLPEHDDLLSADSLTIPIQFTNP